MRSRNDLTRRRFALALLLPFAAQGSQDPFKITDNVDLVVLDASVKDARGSYVTNLEREAFRVFVEGHPQRISNFERVDAPVTIGLIVDSSGSMRYKRPEVVLAGLAFAKESNRQDEFFVVNFNDHVTLGLPRSIPFTDDITTLHRALFMGEPTGQTALYDAIALGLKNLEAGHHDKRTLIVVSDGGDNVSQLRESGILRLIQESRATIYTIGLLDPEDSDLKPAVLRKFANVSGGEYFEPAKLNDVTAVLRKISDDIRHRYTLSFSPQGNFNSKRVRNIKVAVFDKGRKLSVRTRTSYSVEPSIDMQETSLRDWR